MVRQSMKFHLLPAGPLEEKGAERVKSPGSDSEALLPVADCGGPPNLQAKAMSA